MKCKYCGSNLTIDDERCPFCGKANPFAEKHRSQMRHFTNEYNKTREDVIEKSNRFNSWTVKITIIAVLVAANLLLLYMTSNSWQIQKWMALNDVNRNLQTYSRTLQEYEENQDFIGFSTFYEDKYLGYSDHFKNYRSVQQVCASYQYFYQYLMDIVLMDENTYYTKESRVEYMSEQLEYMYKYSKQEEYSDPNCFTPEHVECMNAAIAECHLLLKTYCGVTDEELAKFPTLSNARRQIIIERGLGIGEK